jgi:hypothetical protein
LHQVPFSPKGTEVLASFAETLEGRPAAVDIAFCVAASAALPLTRSKPSKKANVRRTIEESKKRAS